LIPKSCVASEFHPLFDERASARVITLVERKHSTTVQDFRAQTSQLWLSRQSKNR
jgi:hypothetical protein